MATAYCRVSAVIIPLFGLAPNLCSAQDAPSAAPVLVITADRRPTDLSRTGSTITIVPSDEIERSGAKGLTDVLQSVPGLYIYEQGGIGTATSATLRGASPGQTLVLLDGVPLGDPTGTDTQLDFGSIAVTDIERIEVLRGPQTALYGSRAMGGVINIITRRGGGPAQRSVSIEGGSYGTIHSRASLNGSTERMSYAISVDALHSDGFPRYGYRIGRLASTLPPLPKGDPTNRAGATARFTYKLGDSTELETGFAGYGNSILFDNPFAFDPADVYSRFNHQRQWTGQVYGKLTSLALDGRLKNALTLFANGTDRNVAETESCPPFFDSNCYAIYRGARYGGEYQGDLSLGRYGTLVFGARSETETARTFDEPAPLGSAPNIPGFDASQTTRSVFAIHSVRLGDSIDLSLGGRVDAVEGGATFPTWRSTLAYRIPGTATKLHASVGTGAKIGSLYQRFSAYGDQTLQPETSIGADAGIDQGLFDGRLTVSATGFYNRFRNLIDFRFGGCDAAHPQGCYFNVGRAETSGVETSAEAIVVPDEWRLRASYTFMQSRDLTTGTELLQRPGHKAVISAIYTGIPKLELETRLTLVGSRLDFGPVQLPPYARLDTFATYKVSETVSVFMRGENLTDARYEEAYNYGVAGRSLYGGVKVTW